MKISTLIKNVNLITMVNDKVLENQDVLIEGQTIKTICPSGKQNLTADQTIDGSGKYLMPGLFDMHVHLHDDPYLDLFLMNGITGIRDLGSVTDIFKRRDNIAKGKELGPSLFVSGKILEGDPPYWDGFYVIKTKKQAIDTVHWLKDHQADQVKVYETLPAELYRTSIKEAKKLGMKVAGHFSRYVPATETLDMGLDCAEHYATTLGPHIADLTMEPVTIPGHENQVKYSAYKLDDNRVQKVTAAFKRNKAYLCPTFIVEKQGSNRDNYKQLMSQVDERYFEITKELDWIPKMSNGQEGIDEAQKLFYENYRVLVEGPKKAFKKFINNAIILAGSDTPNPFVVPGISLHQELELLVEAGLTNYEALQAATTNATKYLGVSDELGTVETGKTANLIILNKNPLQNIKNSTTIDTVILNGQPYAQEALAKRALLTKK